MLSFATMATCPGNPENNQFCGRRANWLIALLFMHLFIAPCAMAVQLPADDCEHCHAAAGADECIVERTAIDGDPGLAAATRSGDDPALLPRPPAAAIWSLVRDISHRPPDPGGQRATALPLYLLRRHLLI